MGEGNVRDTRPRAATSPTRRRVVVGILAAAALVAVAALILRSGNAVTASAQTHEAGRVSGVVVQGPMLPVDPGAAVSWPAVTSTVRVYRHGRGQPVTTLRTGSDGRFTVSLPPGTYRLSAQPEGVSTLPIGHEARVKVRAGRTVRVRLWLDTGVRFPAAHDVKPGAVPSGSQQYAQGLEGQTVRWPIHPVSQPGQPDSTPCAATLGVYRYDGTPVATIRSTAENGYTASLPPGRYLVDPHSGVSPADRAAPFSIRILRDRWLSLVVRFDTGIR
jgi:hypothetical protein